MKERHVAVPASYLVLYRDSKILLGLRKGTDYYPGWYSLPAGHVEAGELPRGALAREAKEELGLDLDPVALELVHMQYCAKSDETGDRMGYFFTIDAWTGEPKNAEPEKCEQLAWFSMDALPENVIPRIRDVLLQIQKGCIYSELTLEQMCKAPLS
jgi:8-oxo-dGTP pyrophosphatase MutT (NUDIX family)